MPDTTTDTHVAGEYGGGTVEDTARADEHKAIADDVDAWAQGAGEDDPRIQLAAWLLADAVQTECVDDGRGTLPELLLSMYADGNDGGGAIPAPRFDEDAALTFARLLVCTAITQGAPLFAADLARQGYSQPALSRMADQWHTHAFTPLEYADVLRGHTVPDDMLPPELSDDEHQSIIMALDFLSDRSELADRAALPICREDRSAAPLDHLAKKLRALQASGIAAPW